MADGLYVAMAGAAARSEQLDNLADNLANAQSVGFKASRPAFQSSASFCGAAPISTSVRPTPAARWASARSAKH